MSRKFLDLFLRDLGVLYRARRLYPAANEQVARAAWRAGAALEEWGRPVRFALLGEDAVVEGESVDEASTSLKGFLKALREAGCESALIEARAPRSSLEAWIEHVVAGRRGAFQAEGVATGTLELGGCGGGVALPSGAIAEYLDLLPRVEEALSDLVGERKEGVGRAREIVQAIATHMALGEDLVRPVRDLKSHDDYTFTHALNVCCLSAALARALGASPELLDVIAQAGLCHDVGKQRIPPEILNWNGPLDAEARRQMDAHPTHGARVLLSMADSVHPLIPVVAYQHHMGADRSGYPCLPVGGPPHAASLLVSVADIFDAMRTVRPYRGARTVAAATTVLIQQASLGKLYATHVAALVGTLDVLTPGRPVRLSDGVGARVLVPGPVTDALRPTVETDEGRVLDLSLPEAPALAEILADGP